MRPMRVKRFIVEWRQSSGETGIMFVSEIASVETVLAILVIFQIWILCDFKLPMTAKHNDET